MLRPPTTEKPGCGNPGCRLHGDGSDEEPPPMWIVHLGTVAVIVTLLLAAWLIGKAG